MARLFDVVRKVLRSTDAHLAAVTLVVLANPFLGNGCS